MKIILIILIGIPLSLSACFEKEEPFSYEKAILWHHSMYGSLYAHHRTYDPILLKDQHDKDIFYSGCQYALESVIEYKDECLKSTQ